ncbi:MAG: hypothetical protein D3922_16145, partial [Candidatus Electrothrix sp. AR1]|nr:hypothetical protein [Candidatus Electrothrix sp. AR1]
INKSEEVTFRAHLDYDLPELVPNVVEVEQIDDYGNFIQTEGLMLDNGDRSIGDKIAGDGIFIFRKTYEAADPGEIHFRIKAELDGEVLYSKTFSLTFYLPESDEAWLAMDDALSEAGDLYQNLILKRSPDKAMKEVVVYLKNLSVVEDAGISKGGASIWVRYKDASEGAVILSLPPDTRGSGSTMTGSTHPLTKKSNNINHSESLESSSGNIYVENSKVLIISMFSDEFDHSEGDDIEKIYRDYNRNSGCQKYDIEHLKYEDPNVTSKTIIQALKNLEDYGIIHIISHGTYHENEYVLLTPIEYNEKSRDDFTDDFKEGNRLKKIEVDDRKSKFYKMTLVGVSMEFFKYYIPQSVPSSLVF